VRDLHEDAAAAEEAGPAPGNEKPPKDGPLEGAEATFMCVCVSVHVCVLV